MVSRQEMINFGQDSIGRENPPLPYDMEKLETRFNMLSKSPRKLEIAGLWAQNLTAPKIAQITGLTKHMVESHIHEIYAHFLIHSKRELQDVWKLLHQNS